MLSQTTAWFVRPAASSSRAVGRSPEAGELPVWITNSLLLLASIVLVALACASAWLSYHAQVAYVLVHNGNQAMQARVWALLLDTGTAGVSLLRLYETLRRQPGMATRFSLLGCIAASVTMNLLHTASPTPSGYLVAAIPPVMYAVFLEHLLANLRSLLVAAVKRRSVWRTVALWVTFPAVMWSAHRDCLRREAEGTRPALEICADDRVVLPDAPLEREAEAEQSSGDAVAPEAEREARHPRRGRGPGAKRTAFEAALSDQVRSGDLRIFSTDERERNAAAYQAAASLPAPLSRGAARRYVVQALPRLEDIGRADDPLPAGAPQMAD